MAELPKVSVHPAGKDGLPVLDWLQCMVGTTSVLISAIHAMDREVQLLLNTIQHCPEPDFIHQLNYEVCEYDCDICKFIVVSWLSSFLAI